MNSSGLNRIATLLLFASVFVPTTAGAQLSTATLVAQAEKVARSTRTLSADIVLTHQSSGAADKRSTGKIILEKPNLASIQLTGETEVLQLVSDGRELSILDNSHLYTTSAADPKGKDIASPWWGFPYRFFFTQSFNPFGAVADPAAKLRILPDETIEGQTVHILGEEGSNPMAYAATFYFNQNFILQKSTVRFGPTTFTAELSNVKTNNALTPAEFHFKPPSSAHLKAADLTATMIPSGQIAPDFSLPTEDGTLESLNSIRTGKKATLVNFWYLDCPPCLIEFPEFEKLAEQYRERGFNVVAVNKGDSPDKVKAYVRRKAITFTVLMGGPIAKDSVFERYKVTDSFPATYLLDADGRIVYRAIGGDIAGLRQALANLGFK